MFLLSVSSLMPHFFYLLIDSGIQDWTLNCNCLKIVFTVHLEYTANEPLLFLLQLSALVCPPAACSYLLLWKAAYLHRTVPASFLFCVILCCFRIICLWALSLWCLPAFFFFFLSGIHSHDLKPWWAGIMCAASACTVAQLMFREHHDWDQVTWMLEIKSFYLFTKAIRAFDINFCS